INSMERSCTIPRHLCSTPSTCMSSEVEDVKQGTKPEMERRRRARMNEAFEQLKKFHLINSPNDSSKLEKTDVLELTVNYIRKMHETNGSLNESSPNEIALKRYREGFRAAVDATKSFIQCTLPPNQAIIVNAGLTAVLSNYDPLQSTTAHKSERKRSFTDAFPSSVLQRHSSSSFVPDNCTIPFVYPNIATLQPSLHLPPAPILLEVPQNPLLDSTRQTCRFETPRDATKKVTTDHTKSVVCVICEGKCCCKC
uniref:BHLH domain-containing protein n=1 Tax=Parascaris univalens TaxID=6257 RepID=A0A915BAQ1_PARUN